MARLGLFRCLECEHEFRAREGGLKMCEEYSCISCDATVYITRAPEHGSVLCQECGSEAVPGLKRMCPICRSRYTKITKVEALLD